MNSRSAIIFWVLSVLFSCLALAMLLANYAYHEGCRAGERAVLQEWEEVETWSMVAKG